MPLNGGNKPCTLEAHGTGTLVGDPIEMSAAVDAMHEYHETVTYASVKANLGHLEACAGGAGIVALVVSSLLHASSAANG